MEMRLIDANKISSSIDSFAEMTRQRGVGKTIIPFAKQWLRFTIDNATTIDPLDALGICRCKDCIYLWHDANNDLFCAYKYGLKHPKETDYCPYAKRKENNNV